MKQILTCHMLCFIFYASCFRTGNDEHIEQIFWIGEKDGE
jgi:hypothetical protein